MGLGISISKHTLSFLRLLCEPTVVLSCIFHSALFLHTAYCKSDQLYQLILNVKHIQVLGRKCVCVCVCARVCIICRVLP